MMRKQKSDVTKLLKQISDISNKFNNINHRFENFHIRIGLVEKAIVNGNNKRLYNEESSDEEYGQ